MLWGTGSLFYEQLVSSLEVLDTAGNEMFQMIGVSIGEGQTTINFRPVGEKTPLPDLKIIRWDIPVETRTLDVPFELNDLNLPAGP
jgi:hypothetical protein